LAFAAGLELDIATTRFTAFRARISELDTIRQKHGDAAAFERFVADVELNAVALSESQELTTVVPFLRSVPSDWARKKLQIVLKGPELPADEDENSSHARNTMFELNLAARIVRAGMDVAPTSISHAMAFAGSANASVHTSWRASRAISTTHAGNLEDVSQGPRLRPGACWRSRSPVR
jgi:hypothetical protein